MPIGYIVGKQYRLDYNYDRYAVLDVWKRIVRESTKRGLSLETKYSHTGRNYSAEVKHMMRFDNSAHIYLVSMALKHAETPLEAMMLALRQTFTKHPGFDALMQALFLEAEVVLLGMALQDAKDREAKQGMALGKALIALDAALQLLRDDDDWHSDIPLGQPKPIPAAPDEDDDL